MTKKIPSEIISFGGHGGEETCRCGHNEMSHTATVKRFEDLVKPSTKFKCNVIGCSCKNFRDPETQQVKEAQS